MSEVTHETVLAALSKSQKPMTISGIARALSHYTRYPWAVLAAVIELEAAGRVAWEKGRRPWRVRLVEGSSS